MHRIKLKLTVLILFLLFSMGAELSARHIIGGDITYSCISLDTVNNRVTMLFEYIIYRDCDGGGAQFDDEFSFGIYEQSVTGVWRYIDFVNTRLGTVNELDPKEDNPCVIVPPNVCVEEGRYSFTYTFDIINTSYMVAYQRCCRNNTISNIYDPGDQGAAYTITISPEAQLTCNNSPKFNNFPPIVICVDNPLSFDHSATDREGDAIVYEFCTPQTAGGQDGANGQPCLAPTCSCVRPLPQDCAPPFRLVQFRAPAYTAARPVGGNPVVAIDQVTGLITGTPTEQGQFVVGVCAKEYRNGVLLTTVRRDFQFNITYCEPTVVAEIQHDATVGDSAFVVNSCGDNVVELVNESYNENFIFDYRWEFDINGNIQGFDTKDVTVTFPGVGQYKGVMMINRGTICADTADVTVNIFPEIIADYDYIYDTCVAGPVLFTDSSFSGSGTITDWMWDFGGGGQSSAINPSHQFQTPGDKNVNLFVRDINDCTDEIDRIIRYYPVPPLIVIEPSSFIGCAPGLISFVNLSVPIDSTYDVIWDFGDGTTENALSPSHLFENPGTYSIRIEITSPLGCFTSAEFPNWITIEESPIADFSYTPDMLTNFDRTVSFRDQSTGAGSWQWNFDQKAVLFEKDPVYTFQDTGVHRIELIVTHPSGCPDTIVKFIDIVPISTFHVPNAFSPNDDGKNDDFKGKGYIEGLSNFTMTIWNRWGEMVFATDNPGEGWNGRKLNSGAESPIGVYVYQIEYIAPRGEVKTLKGYATLIR